VAVLALALPPDSYDVNVTPDKRKVFMEGEVQLVAALEQVGAKAASRAECSSVHHRQSMRGTGVLCDAAAGVKCLRM
jgi:DNA mismatch repair ATPase MutL